MIAVIFEVLPHPHTKHTYFGLAASLRPRLDRGEVLTAAQAIKALVHEVGLRQFSDPPAVCLACTELPLAFPAQHDCAAFDCDGIRYVNSSVVHIAAAGRSG